MPNSPRRSRRPSSTMGLRCFVAMRIGDSDADAIYERRIQPTIRRVGLAPRRIDRVMHNERIDQKILSELQTCHAVVSDLTFARPSVYWEAGFAEGRNVPVVYTCRKDHLKGRVDDEFGNFKVHFDLQTKNIIPWTSPRDRQFSTQLERRLRYVLRPLFREQAKAEERKHEEETFAALSMTSRRKRVVDAAIRDARRLRFSGRRQDADIDDARFEPRWFSVGQYGAKLACDQPRWAHTVLVLVVPKLTKSALREIHSQIIRRPIDDARARKAVSMRRAVVDHAIVVSFAPVSPNLVGETLSLFQRDLSEPWLAWSTVTDDWSTSGSRRRHVLLHLLSNVRSERQAREGLKQVLSQLPVPSSRQSR